MPLDLVPTIQTRRLKLRAHSSSDLATCLQLWTDPQVYRPIGGKAATEQEAWWRILRYRGLWEVLGYGYWVIEDLATGKMIGEIGFADFKRELPTSMGGVPEAGWVLSSQFHGLGFASEALQAILKWADSVAKFDRTFCIINPENKVSIHLARKGGYQSVATVQYLGHEVIVFERSRELF